jgi:hypothetical protein
MEKPLMWHGMCGPADYNKRRSLADQCFPRYFNSFDLLLVLQIFPHIRSIWVSKKKRKRAA